MLQNMATNLDPLKDVSQLSGMVTSLTQITTLMNQAQGIAFNVNSTTFRSIEIFTTVAGLYVAVTFAATILLAVVGRAAFRARIRIL